MSAKHVLGALAAGVTSALAVNLVLNASLRDAIVHIDHTYLVLLKGGSLDRILDIGTLSWLAVFLFLGMVGGLAGAAILVSVAKGGGKIGNGTRGNVGSTDGDGKHDVSIGVAALGGVMGAVFFFFLFVLAELAMDK